MMSQHRLTGLDSLFLAAESPGKLLHVMAVLLLDPETVPGGYSFEHLREFLAARIHLVPPMRRRLLEVPLGIARPVWVEDSELDLDRHLRRAAVPAPGGRAELVGMAAEFMERPLDRSRPLWEMVAVEGVEGGRVALLAKLHHSMMDGMAGMQFMASLLSREPEFEEPARAGADSRARVPGSLEMLRDAMPTLLGRPLRMLQAVRQTLHLALQRAVHERVRGRALPSRVSVPRTWLNQRVSSRRSLAYGSISLSRIREVASAHSATVNDVVLAVVSGALRRDFDSRGLLPEAPLIAAVPVSTHEEGDDLANSYSVLFVPLATDVDGPDARLRAIRDAAQQAKQRQRGLVGDSLAAWADVPTPFEVSLISRVYSDLGLYRVFSPVCNLVVSDVPGPPVPLYFGGARIVGIHPLGPIFDGMILNITAISREDAIDVGIVACAAGLPDPWGLVDALPAALDELTASLSAARPAAPAG